MGQMVHKCDECSHIMAILKQMDKSYELWEYHNDLFEKVETDGIFGFYLVCRNPECEKFDEDIEYPKVPIKEFYKMMEFVNYGVVS